MKKTDIIIEKNIPIVNVKIKDNHFDNYPFREMKKGDSFFIKSKQKNKKVKRNSIWCRTIYKCAPNYNKLSAAATAFAKFSGMKCKSEMFKIRSVPGGFRIWKIV